MVRAARRWRRVLDRSAPRAAPAQWSQNAAAKFRPSADRAGVARGLVGSLDTDGRSKSLRHVAGVTLDSLADATRLLHTAGTERAMSRLIGLGEGRTPAGDDYLVGYFAALCACSDASKAFAAALSARLMVLATRTEDLSRLYLEAAAVVEVSERIAAVATGIAAGSDNAAIGRAVAAALAVGHSSGAAAVFGLLHGCAACAEFASSPR